MNPQKTFLFVSVLTFLCSLNAFLAEANLTQTIAASLGGTIVHYQLCVGIFIVFLGLGSLSYPQIIKSFSNKKILILSSLALSLLSMASPFFMRWLDQSLHITGASLWHLIYYLPIISVGLITGLDLPALIFFSKTHSTAQEEIILGLDYLGMFLASLCFPFLVLRLGVFHLTYINAGLAVLSLGLLALIPNIPTPPTERPLEAQQKPPGLLLLITFLLSVCSLSYELILARWFVDFFENEVFAMTFTVGFFLLGLGLGSLTYSKKNPTRQIILIEVMLILGMLILPLVLLVLASFWNVFFTSYIPQKTLLFFLLLMVTWVGFWSGKELPFLMSLVGNKKEKQLSILFFTNYLGALLATILVTLLLIPIFGIYFSILLIIGLNLLTLLLISSLFKKDKPLFWASLVILSALALLVPQQQVRWQQVFLKTTYHKLSLSQISLTSVRNLLAVTDDLDDVLRISSAYQNIDLVRTQLPYEGLAHNELNLYLNHQPQFSLESLDLYHDSFSHGAINLHGKVPQNILILGGGDGFLANKLSKIRGINKITLLELDPEMIKLATHHLRISQANGHIFSSSKVQIIINDAFSWLKQNSKKFDAIFIDFPYPANYELSRLYSVEFYRLVKFHLNHNGFLILNAPFSFSLNTPNTERLKPALILLNTLRSAGFQSLFPFGAIEPFLYAEQSPRKIKFNYHNLPKNFLNSSFVNLLPISQLQNTSSSDKVNSIYRPRKVTTW